MKQSNKGLNKKLQYSRERSHKNKSYCSKWNEPTRVSQHITRSKNIYWPSNIVYGKMVNKYYTMAPNIKTDMAQKYVHTWARIM